MLKLAVLCSFIFAISAKSETNSTRSDYGEQLKPKPELIIDAKDIVYSKDLWVLEIDDFLLSSVTLWAGNKEEDDQFEDMYGDIIARLEQRQGRVNRQQRILRNMATEDKEEEIAVKRKIMRILNKFALSAMTDPDAFLYETEQSDDQKPSIRIYFKGPYAYLAVVSGNMRRHYFIAPPSPLPLWFYERHQNPQRAGRTKYVTAPKEVQFAFFKGLLNLLHVFLSVPM